MSGWEFDYIENKISELAEWYSDWNKQEEKYSENIKEIPEWLINLLNELSEITHNIDYDLSGDSSVEDDFFEIKKEKLKNILLNN